MILRVALGSLAVWTKFDKAAESLWKRIGDQGVRIDGSYLVPAVADKTSAVVGSPGVRFPSSSLQIY